jgi:hypothetical protein
VRTDGVKVRTDGVKVRTDGVKVRTDWRKGAHRWRKSAHRWRKGAHLFSKNAHLFGKNSGNPFFPHSFFRLVMSRLRRLKEIFSEKFRRFFTAESHFLIFFCAEKREYSSLNCNYHAWIRYITLCVSDFILLL